MGMDELWDEVIAEAKIHGASGDVLPDPPRKVVYSYFDVCYVLLQEIKKLKKRVKDLEEA